MTRTKGMLKKLLASVAVAITATPVVAAPPSIPTSMDAYPKGPQAPANAPNIMVIMTDDVGFGASSTFGGLIATPVFDQLAAQGLRFNRFHTTALCAPSRAALLTGRNHHAVNTGVITEIATGRPAIRRCCRMMPSPLARYSRTMAM